jgi:RNA polymerase sigma-B factor
MGSGHAYRPTSLHTPVGEADGFELGDMLGSEDHGFDLTDLTVSLPPAMKALTARERDIVLLRFYGNLTQAAIAERVGISQMQVSRVLVAALAKLRVQLGEG